MTSFVYVVSYCHLSAIFKTMSIIVETYKTIELWFEFLSHILRFSFDSPSYFPENCMLLRGGGVKLNLNLVAAVLAMLSWGVPIGTSRMNPFTHEQSFQRVCLFTCTSVHDPLSFTCLFSCLYCIC